jgi:hypothetical protein
VSDPAPKLRHQVNPCDHDRFAFLKPVGDAAAAFWDRFTGDTECACCLGIRLAVTLAAIAVLTAALTALLT